LDSEGQDIDQNLMAWSKEVVDRESQNLMR